MALLPAALVIIVGLAFFSTSRRMGETRAEHRLAQEITRTQFERAALRDEYLRFRTERAKTQWHLKTASIERLLLIASKSLRDKNERALVDDMRQSLGKTIDLFSRLEATDGKEDLWGRGRESAELRERVMGQLMVHARELLSNAQQLEALADAKLSSTYLRTSWIVFGFVVSFSLIISAGSFFIGSNIFRRVVKLHDGMKVATAGNLDYTVDAGGDDEFGKLAHAFNEMTGTLRKTYFKLREYKEHLEELIESRTAQLDAANKELEAFAYSVSHDLRAPLRHITGFMGLLEKCSASNLDEKGRRYLGIIAESANHMGLLIDDLLSFSRMGRAEMQQTAVDLNRIVEEALKTVEDETRGKNIAFAIDELPEIQGDPAMLRVVFTNLLSNAVKFTRQKEGALVEVGHIRNNDEHVLFVRDNGVGFDMRYVDKLFGVFQRLHGESEFEGTGIGLATVRRVIHRSGGRTWAEGKVGEGATFYFSLPDGSGNRVNSPDSTI